MPSVPFARLVATSAAVAATRSRKAKIQALADLLGELDEHEAVLAAYYLSGQLPQGRIGIGPAAVAENTLPPAAGAPSLTVADVHAIFGRLAATRGAGSRSQRARQLAALRAASTAAEWRFLASLLTGALRQGALEGVMADGIAQAFALDPSLVRRAAMLSGDLPRVARLAYRQDADALAAVRMSVLQPLQPMLAATGNGVDDVLAKLASPAFESKLDGARVQIHRRDDRIRIFSRQLNDVTAALPEIVELINGLPTGRVVLEGEAIALRPDGRPHPFQTTMRRFGRRQDVGALARELPMSLRAFDCLHVNGEDLIDAPLRLRLQALDELLAPEHQVQRLLCAERAAVDTFVEDVLAQGHEGVMAKDLDAPYAAGRRGSAWLKLKPAYTADLVVLGCEWGSGRRRGLLSNLRLAARTGDGEYVLVGKTFKGLSDETLRWQTLNFPPLAAGEDALGLRLHPRVVYEVAFDGVQESTQYPSGIALRFARYRRRRDDKTPAQATTLAELRERLQDGAVPPHRKH